MLQTPGALPLLSFTLYELYLSYAKNPDGSRALTEANYKKIGGVIGSLRRRINEEYEKFKDSPKYQETMRRILLRMVAFEGGELTRRQVPIWEFEYPDAEENERVEEIRKTLLEARLLVGNDSEDGDDKTEPYVEAAHDELIVAWEKLFEWRDKEGEKMLLHRQLTRAAADCAFFAGEVGGGTGAVPFFVSISSFWIFLIEYGKIRRIRVEIEEGRYGEAVRKKEGQIFRTSATSAKPM